MFAPRLLVEALVTEQVACVVIGGVALTLHGSARATYDLDLCYSRDRANLQRLARALAPWNPRLRDFPPELPFLWDEHTLHSGLNFTLRCDVGDIDLRGEVPGLGAFAEVAAVSEVVEIYGHAIRILTLDGLERSKRAAGRAKDLLDLETIASIRRARAEE